MNDEPKTAGKLRCDKEEMEWLATREGQLNAQIAPMSSELELVRKRIKKLRAKSYRKPDPSIGDELEALTSKRDGIKAAIKTPILMRNELAGYIENRVAH